LYAIGDIVGGLMLAHTAAHEGIVAAHTTAGDKDVHPIDYVKQPRATYCRPEIASIGLTQQQCEERGLPIKVGKVPFQAIAKAIIGGEYEGFAKVIANKETDETLGIHIIGPHPKATPKKSAAGSALGADLGLNSDDLLEMYRLVALSRAVDERMWVLNRAGRIPFVISGQGHEGAQVGITWALEKGKDWIAPFYRSIATCLTFGMSPRDIMTAQYATASDPSSGGRQMPGHYGSHEHNLVSVSSPVATQLLHAVGLALAAKIRKTGQVALTVMGEGSSNQGDVHEGLNFAAIHKLPSIS